MAFSSILKKEAVHSSSLHTTRGGMSRKTVLFFCLLFNTKFLKFAQKWHTEVTRVQLSYVPLLFRSPHVTKLRIYLWAVFVPWIWGSHSGGCEGYCLRGCDTV
jgi:hypothetical protein